MKPCEDSTIGTGANGHPDLGGQRTAPRPGFLHLVTARELQELRDAVEKKADLSDRVGWSFSASGNTLTWTATVDDPDVLLEPWTTTPRVALLNPRPDAMLPESLPCSERDLAHTVTKEHH